MAFFFWLGEHLCQGCVAEECGAVLKHSDASLDIDRLWRADTLSFLAFQSDSISRAPVIRAGEK
jgi:hypothetical protein